MSTAKWWKIEDEILERYSKGESYRKTKNEFPNELNERISKFTYHVEISIGIVFITLPWLILLKYPELSTFFGIGSIVVIGVLMIIIANDKVKNYSFDIGPDGIVFKNQLLKWNQIVEIQKVRLSKKRRPVVLRILTNDVPIELSLNSDLNPKPHQIIEYIKYMINKN